MMIGEEMIQTHRLTFLAILDGVFIKPGTTENYSQSWVESRLRHNDKKVAGKIVRFSASI